MGDYAALVAALRRAQEHHDAYGQGISDIWGAAADAIEALTHEVERLRLLYEVIPPERDIFAEHAALGAEVERLRTVLWKVAEMRSMLPLLHSVNPATATERAEINEALDSFWPALRASLGIGETKETQ